MRPAVPLLVEKITEQVQERVEVYAGNRSGRRWRLIYLAVTGAVNQFVSMIEGTESSGAGVDDLFRRMGHGEAIDGNDLEPMRRALDIATRDAWQTLHTLATEHGMTSDLMGEIGGKLLEFIEYLLDQVAHGYDSGLTMLATEASQRRHDLVDAVLAAKPRLVAALRADVLAPLEDLGPATRAALATTLAAWLPTRPTAVEVAERLGVHPQTVRRRLHRLRVLFGEALDDPDHAVAIVVAVLAPGSPARAPSRRRRG